MFNAQTTIVDARANTTRVSRLGGVSTDGHVSCHAYALVQFLSVKFWWRCVGAPISGDEKRVQRIERHGYSIHACSPCLEGKQERRGGGLSWQKRRKENGGGGREEITTFCSKEKDFN